MKNILNLFNTSLHHEQIRALYQQSIFVLIATFGITLLIVFFFWGKVDYKTLIFWVVLNLSLTLIRAILVNAFTRTKPQGESLVV